MPRRRSVRFRLTGVTVTVLLVGVSVVGHAPAPVYWSLLVLVPAFVAFHLLDRWWDETKGNP